MRKATLFTLCIMLATLCQAQNWPIKTITVPPMPRHIPTGSIVATSDFTMFLSSVGAEGGMYGMKSRHSYLATIDMDYISNAQLIRYHKEEYVQPTITAGRATYAAGFKYLFRIGPMAPYSFRLVANPYYAWNLKIFSAYTGGRLTYNFGREMLHGELVIDPVSGRLMLKFLATVNLKRKA